MLKDVDPLMLEFAKIDIDALEMHVKKMVFRINSIIDSKVKGVTNKPEVRQVTFHPIDFRTNLFFRYYNFLAPPTRFCIIFTLKNLEKCIDNLRDKERSSGPDFFNIDLFDLVADYNFFFDCHRIHRHGRINDRDVTGLIEKWTIFIKDINCKFEKIPEDIVPDFSISVYDATDEDSSEILPEKKSIEVNKKVKKKLQELTFPPDLKWQLVNFIMRSDDIITIKVPSLNWSVRLSYHELGMVDLRKGDEPSKLWIALRMLCKFNGRIQWSNPEVVQDKKTLSRLSTFMKNAFGIDDNFFKRYSRKHGYVAKSAFEDRRGEDSI
jgi:hypothetical protein